MGIYRKTQLQDADITAGKGENGVRRKRARNKAQVIRRQQKKNRVVPYRGPEVLKKEPNPRKGVVDGRLGRKTPRRLFRTKGKKKGEIPGQGKASQKRGDGRGLSHRQKRGDSHTRVHRHIKTHSAIGGEKQDRKKNRESLTTRTGKHHSRRTANEICAIRKNRDTVLIHKRKEKR